MTKQDIEKYFYAILDKDLHNSIESWQIARIKNMVIKAIKKGKNLPNKK